jgi:Phage integrase family
VPLDQPTLAALDEWITRRGPQRALPHPRLNRPAGFLFTERGRRLTAFRLRRGLDDAATAAGLRGRDGQTLRVTPHQLRHTYATTLINSGMSLQALMALLGHVSTEMTLRYAALAAPAVRTAYEEAMSKARTRLTLAIAPVGQPIIPGRIEWLRAEMLKTGSRTATAPDSSPPKRAPTPTSANSATTTSPPPNSSRSSKPS